MVFAKLRLAIVALLFTVCALTAHAVGPVQRQGAQATSSANVTNTLTITAGNMIIADVFDSNSGSTNTPIVTDNQGDVFVAMPYSIIGNPPGISIIFVCYNAHGGSTTVTANSNGGGNVNWDLIVTEVNGMANHAALAGYAYGWALTSNTQTTDPVTLPAGTYYLYSPVGDLTSGSTYTGTAGFTGTTFSASYVHEVFDQTVTIASPTTYSNVITSSGTFGGSSANCILAFSTTPYTNARILQIGGGGTSLGVVTAVAYMPSPVTIGDYLIAFLNWNGAAGSSITDTLGNTWTRLEGGTSSDSFGLYETIASSTGSDVISGTAGASPSLQVYELAGTSAIDTHASAGAGNASNTTITPGLTTAVANELVIGFGGSETGCNTQGINVGGTGFTWAGEMGAHCSSSVSFQAFAATTGSYSLTITTSPSGTISGAVIAFKPAVAGGSGTQPVVNIISENFAPVFHFQLPPLFVGE